MANNGDIPHGACVLHKCDNRKCINPNHLFLGTKRDNTQDMIAKGRRTATKLTKREVWHMRRLKYSGMKYERLASLFGVSVSLVQKIKRRLLWV
jgi:HNH endonuclease